MPAACLVIAFCVLIVVMFIFIHVIIDFLYWKPEKAISDAQQEMVNWAVNHRYPNSTMIRADGYSGAYFADRNSASILVHVTFETTDSYATVKKWYQRNYRIGWYGSEASHFAYVGIRQIDAVVPGKVRYIVPYMRSIDCEGYYRCVKPPHQIR